MAKKTEFTDIIHVRENIARVRVVKHEYALAVSYAVEISTKSRFGGWRTFYSYNNQDVARRVADDVLIKGYIEYDRYVVPLSMTVST